MTSRQSPSPSAAATANFLYDTVQPHAQLSWSHRHKSIDGWRGVAASFAVIAHAVNYRLIGTGGAVVHYLQRLSEPLSTTDVRIFFVISGFIITYLLKRGIKESGRVSITAFYERRVCRVLPPLLLL